MPFQNAMSTLQTARVAPMPRAHMFEILLDQTYPTSGFRSGRQSQRWQDQILPKKKATDTRPEPMPQTKTCHRAGEEEIYYFQTQQNPKHEERRQL